MCHLSTLVLAIVFSNALLTAHAASTTPTSSSTPLPSITPAETVPEQQSIPDIPAPIPTPILLDQTVPLKDGVVSTFSFPLTNRDPNGDTTHFSFQPNRNPGLTSVSENMTLYVSLSTCSLHETLAPLQLWYSQNSRESTPGPNSGGVLVKDVGDTAMGQVSLANSDEKGRVVGFSEITIPNWIPSQVLYIGVFAPPLLTSDSDWTFQLEAGTRASVNKYYHLEPGIEAEDTDAEKAVFLTRQQPSSGPTDSQFEIYFIPLSSSASTQGTTSLPASQCALRRFAATGRALLSMNGASVIGGGGLDMQISPTDRRGGNRHQVIVNGLSTGQKYMAYLVQKEGGAGSSSAGGSVYRPIQLVTKTDNTCRLISNLAFCDQVAYAVPVPDADKIEDASPSAITEDLAGFYDDIAQSRYDAFSQALAQFDCHSTKYSLVRNCSDCDKAYKAWICAVSIPRCGDSNQLLTVTQSSDRQEQPASVPLPKSAIAVTATAGLPIPPDQIAFISPEANSFTPTDYRPQNYLLRTPVTVIRGPPVNTSYTEILPCIGLCYAVVQGCPSYFGFACPLERNTRVAQYGMKEIIVMTNNKGEKAFQDGIRPKLGIRCNGMGSAEYEVAEIVLPNGSKTWLASTRYISWLTVFLSIWIQLL